MTVEGVPVLIHLPGAQLQQLERIAQRQGVTVRDLIVWQVGQGLHRRRRRTAGQTAMVSRDEEIIAMGRAGTPQKVIADRFGLSISRVSRVLTRAGVRRHSRHEPEADG